MIIVFASYGNDSIALIQWAKEQGLEDVTVAYSDTGWAAEWWSDRVAAGEKWVKSLGYTPVTLRSEGMAGLVRRKNAFPRGGGGKYQFCTAALKEAPASAWLAEVDPDCEAVCMIGIRREESANRATFPEWTDESEKHGGRELWAPLVRHLESDRDILINNTPFTPIPFRSKECWPCVNARKGELRRLEPTDINRIASLEIEMGINSKGNPIVMFSPKREGGAVGIEAVVKNAEGSRAKDAPDINGGCDSGWCGG
jgi:3'-phosphoadenosine 5'-phosphosulfate sulfotransferase (PAPS reductase)/FAD synthetase